MTGENVKEESDTPTESEDGDKSTIDALLLLFHNVNQDFKAVENRQWDELSELNSTSARYMPVLVLFSGAIAFFGRWLSVTCWPPIDKSIFWHIAVFTLLMVCLTVAWISMVSLLARHNLEASRPTLPLSHDFLENGLPDVVEYYGQQVQASQQAIEANDQILRRCKSIFARGQLATLGAFFLTLVLSCFYFFSPCAEGNGCPKNVRDYEQAKTREALVQELLKNKLDMAEFPQ